MAVIINTLIELVAIQNNVHVISAIMKLELVLYYIIIDKAIRTVNFFLFYARVLLELFLLWLYSYLDV